MPNAMYNKIYIIWWASELCWCRTSNVTGVIWFLISILFDMHVQWIYGWCVSACGLLWAKEYLSWSGRFWYNSGVQLCVSVLKHISVYWVWFDYQASTIKSFGISTYIRTHIYLKVMSRILQLNVIRMYLKWYSIYDTIQFQEWIV